MEPTDSDFERKESAIEDVGGAPTWPILSTAALAQPDPPPVGLNWGTVAQHLGIDLSVLLHDGAIVLTGEYFPEGGYAIDPVSLIARPVDVGDMALQPCYFLGDLTLAEFRLRVPTPSQAVTAGHPVVRSARGPIIGLFPDRSLAERARMNIMRGSLAAGLTLEDGPLGVELRVERPELPGRVATIITRQRGAVISLGGQTVASWTGEGQAVATGGIGSGDVPRAGMGVITSSATSEPGSPGGTG